MDDKLTPETALKRIDLPGGYWIEVLHDGQTCAIIKPDDGDYLNGVFNIKKALAFATAMNTRAETKPCADAVEWDDAYKEGFNDGFGEGKSCQKRAIQNALDAQDAKHEALLKGLVDSVKAYLEATDKRVEMMMRMVMGCDSSGSDRVACTHLLARENIKSALAEYEKEKGL